MAKRRPQVHVYDSLTVQEFPDHRRYAIAYEPIWQSIRHNLRWAEYESARESLAKCDVYVSFAKSTERVRRRVWRVFNLLCAIPHGQTTDVGARMIERNSSTILIPAMAQYRERLNDIGYPTEWDWNWSRINAQKMKQVASDQLEEVYRTLLHTRGAKARRWQGKPEFWYYMSILEEVIGIADKGTD